MPDPLILAFDTSAAHCAAVLLRGGTVLAALHEDMTKGQAERLMPMLEEALAQVGAAWADLSALGVGIGPGNFTGIRISVSAARGLSLALRVPAVGVSRFEALALGHTTPVLAAVAAPGGRAYLQRLGDGPASEPVQISVPDVPRHLRDPALLCLAEDAQLAATIAHEIRAKWARPGMPLAEAIARIAASRPARAGERPAPLYIRPADAAPMREAPPVILP